MDDSIQAETDDIFSEVADNIAALARQLFRAIQAEDRTAAEVYLFYLRYFVVKDLEPHLRRDPHWGPHWGPYVSVLGPA